MSKEKGEVGLEYDINEYHEYNCNDDNKYQDPNWELEESDDFLYEWEYDDLSDSYSRKYRHQNDNMYKRKDHDPDDHVVSVDTKGHKRSSERVHKYEKSLDCLYDWDYDDWDYDDLDDCLYVLEYEESDEYMYAMYEKYLDDMPNEELLSYSFDTDEDEMDYEELYENSDDSYLCYICVNSDEEFLEDNWSDDSEYD